MFILRLLLYCEFDKKKFEKLMFFIVLIVDCWLLFVRDNICVVLFVRYKLLLLEKN